MSEEQSEAADMEIVELPPVLVQFLNEVRADQRKLMKDKNFAQPDQFRKFFALHFMERFMRAVEMLGTTALDTHQLGVSNATQLQRMRRWVAKHLRALGAEVSDGEAFAEIGTEEIDACGQALYALGSHLQAKYPNDKDTEEKFNAFAFAYAKLIEALMGDQGAEDDEDEDGEDDEDEGEDEEAVEAEESSSAEETDGPSGDDA